MKDIIRLSATGIAMCALFAWAMLNTAETKELPASLTSEEVSWVEFCKYKGYDPHTDDEEIVNEFLDTWRGSTVEEEALTRQGIEV